MNCVTLSDLWYVCVYVCMHICVLVVRAIRSLRPKQKKYIVSMFGIHIFIWASDATGCPPLEIFMCITPLFWNCAHFRFLLSFGLSLRRGKIDTDTDRRWEFDTYYYYLEGGNLSMSVIIVVNAYKFEERRSS